VNVECHRDFNEPQSVTIGDGGSASGLACDVERQHATSPGGHLVMTGTRSVPAGVHILVVDDERGIRAAFTRYLLGEGFRVSEAADGPTMRACLARGGIDLVLLDLVLPGDDGFSLAREIRAHSPGIGIIMITGRGDVIDRVAGLELGADDYIAKPFHLREVLARIRTVLRRAPTAAPAGTAPAEPVFRFEGWTVEPTRRRVTAPDGGTIQLTTAEFDLLLAFVTHAGHVLNRDQLMDLVKGPNWAANDRTIDQQVARLRRKIEADPATPTLIKSIRAVGYQFAAEVRRG
jgi:DNA-binding response OmpR family regulator